MQKAIVFYFSISLVYQHDRMSYHVCRALDKCEDVVYDGCWVGEALAVGRPVWGHSWLRPRSPNQGTSVQWGINRRTQKSQQCKKLCDAPDKWMCDKMCELHRGWSLWCVKSCVIQWWNDSRVIWRISLLCLPLEGKLSLGLAPVTIKEIRR